MRKYNNPFSNLFEGFTVPTITIDEILDGVGDILDKTTTFSTCSQTKSNLFMDGVSYISKDGYMEIQIELAGYKKSEIEMLPEEIKDGKTRLTVKTVKEWPEKIDGKVLRDGRLRTNFNKTFDLQSSLDSSKIEASYVDGLLTITIPEKEKEKPQKIEIK